MKNWQIFLVIGTLLLGVTLLSGLQREDESFEKWRNQFGFDFTLEEMSYRQLIFIDNVKQISKHNADPSQTYQLGVNQFTHLTSQEFKEMILNKYYSTHESTNQRSEEELKMNAVLREVDWQALGKVSAVSSQGLCDAGYAFCSSSLIESYYLFLSQNVSLSKQQIIDCSANYTTFGCQGGSRNGTLQYIRDVGLNTERDYPFKGVKGVCLKPTGDYKPVYTHVEYNGCNDIQNGLYSSPMTVAVNAETWQHYRSGIYNGCTSTQVNHDTYLIGVNSESWRLKNSWGVTWGEYGYIRLKLGNTCGICEKPGFAFKK